MRNENYDQLSIRLEQVYDKVRDEVGFDLTLADLITNRAQWKTDIARSLDRAIWHLLMAQNSGISHDTQLEELSNADLVIRDLLAQLVTEEEEIQSREATSKIGHISKWYLRSRHADRFSR